MSLKKLDNLTAPNGKYNDEKAPQLEIYESSLSKFSKPTSTGGLLTIAALISILALCIIEQRSYSSIVIRNTLKVDNTLGHDMRIFFDISFPDVPCHLISIDVMDMAGDVQQDVELNIKKSYITQSSKIPIEAPKFSEKSESYCGPCYGALEEGCCNSCKAVLQAYTQRGWMVSEPSSFEQCAQEKYAETVNLHRASGCQMKGFLDVKKVKGTFHFAPGLARIDVTRGDHSHDLKGYFKDADQDGKLQKHTFSHEIHQLAFGNDKQDITDTDQPLNGHKELTDSSNTHFDYFLKCVSRSFVPFTKSANFRDGSNSSPIERSGYQTTSYSAAKHSRDFLYSNDDTPSHINIQSTVPGVFFYYDISPLHIIDEEARQVSLGELFSSITAVIGGVITLFALLNHGIKVVVEKWHKTK